MFNTFRYVIFAMIGLALVMGLAAHAEDDAQCTFSATLRARPHYDRDGRLVAVKAASNKMMLFWRASKLDEVIVNEVKFVLDKPNRYTNPGADGKHEQWGANRWSHYDSNGKLATVNTYELTVEKPGKLSSGYQTTYEIPADIDWSKHRGADGKIHFEGPAVLRTLDGHTKPYAIKKPLLITEPLDSQSKCISFQGESFALRLPAGPIDPPKVETEVVQAPKKVSAPAPAAAPKPRFNSDICGDPKDGWVYFENGCIRVTDGDDDDDAAPGQQEAE